MHKYSILESIVFTRQVYQPIFCPGMGLGRCQGTVYNHSYGSAWVSHLLKEPPANPSPFFSNQHAFQPLRIALGGRTNDGLRSIIRNLHVRSSHEVGTAAPSGQPSASQAPPCCCDIRARQPFRVKQPPPRGRHTNLAQARSDIDDATAAAVGLLQSGQQRQRNWCCRQHGSLNPGQRTPVSQPRCRRC